MDGHFFWVTLGPQFFAAILQIANQFLLFRVDGNHWLMLSEQPAHLLVDVLELPIALAVAGPIQCLAVGLKAIAHFMQQLNDGSSDGPGA